MVMSNYVYLVNKISQQCVRATSDIVHLKTNNAKCIFYETLFKRESKLIYLLFVDAVYLYCFLLTHWSQRDVAAISKVNFSNSVEMLAETLFV